MFNFHVQLDGGEKSLVYVDHVIVTKQKISHPIVTKQMENVNVNQNFTLNNIQQELSSGVTINQKNATGNSFNSNLNAGILVFNGFKVRASKAKFEELVKQNPIIAQMFADHIQYHSLSLQEQVLKEQATMAAMQPQPSSKNQEQIYNSKKLLLVTKLQ